MRGRLKRAAGDPVFNRYREAFEAARVDPGTPVFYPAVAVYVGDGASHSWIWFADLLERIGLFDVTFVREQSVCEGLGGFDALLVGGGDTYAMAEGLADGGAYAIREHLLAGGFYYGSCAGAYLVLSGVDLEPFTPFAFVPGRMANVMPDPPIPRCLEHKYLARYGEEWVFHPVYGEVLIRGGAGAHGFGCLEDGAVKAPLFGGPVILDAPDEAVVATYAGLTGRAAFLWPRERAEALVAGAQAVLASGYGDGTVVASGPHLEHPLFPAANSVVAELLLRHCSGETARARAEAVAGTQGKVDMRRAESAFWELKRQVSNARIVAFGLEKVPVTWRMGLKVWEPEKLRMFIETAWNRLPYLEPATGASAGVEVLEGLAGGYGCVTAAEKSIKIKIESGEDSQQDALSLLLTLKELTATFLLTYFRLRLEGTVGRAGRAR